jgi:hypothetical protein
MTLNISDDMQIPPANTDAYAAIYRLENWLRRICLTAYMCTYGSQWADHLDRRVHSSLARRVRVNRDRLYLNAETDDNLIWLTMHRELHTLLRHEGIWKFVQQVLGLPEAMIDAKLSELNEIRNLLAHNRALTPTTRTILDGLSASLEAGILNFKSSVLYGDYEIISATFVGDKDDELGYYVDNLMDGNDWSRFQAFAARGRDLYEFVSLPAERNDRDWPSAAALLKTFASVSHLILSFCLNLSGSEYRVFLPRALSQAEVKLVADRFFNNPQVWTTRPYEAQPLQHVCNPKIWFYENTYPEF